MQLIALLLVLSTCTDQTANKFSPSNVTFTLVQNGPMERRDTINGRFIEWDHRLLLSGGWDSADDPPYTVTDYQDLWLSKNTEDWERVTTSTPFDIRALMVSYRGKLYAIGDTCWVSSDARSWTKIKDPTPMATSGWSHAFVFNDRIEILGGGYVHYNTQDCVTFNVSTVSPHQISLYAAAPYNGAIYLTGGMDTSQPDPAGPGIRNPTYNFLNSVWRSDENGDNYTEILADGHAQFGHRQWHNMFVWQGKLWMAMGYDDVSGLNLKDFYWTENGLTWTQLTTVPSNFNRKHWPGVTTFGDDVLIFGGNDWPTDNQLWQMSVQ